MPDNVNLSSGHNRSNSYGQSESQTWSDTVSKTEGYTVTREFKIQPEEFTSLCDEWGKSEAIIYSGGRTLYGKANAMKAVFYEYESAFDMVFGNAEPLENLPILERDLAQLNAKLDATNHQLKRVRNILNAGV